MNPPPSQASARQQEQLAGSTYLCKEHCPGPSICWAGPSPPAALPLCGGSRGARSASWSFVTPAETWPTVGGKACAPQTFASTGLSILGTRGAQAWLVSLYLPSSLLDTLSRGRTRTPNPWLKPKETLKQLRRNKLWQPACQR